MQFSLATIASVALLLSTPALAAPAAKTKRADQRVVPLDLPAEGKFNILSAPDHKVGWSRLASTPVLDTNIVDGNLDQLVWQFRPVEACDDEGTEVEDCVNIFQIQSFQSLDCLGNQGLNENPSLTSCFTGDFPAGKNWQLSCPVPDPAVPVGAPQALGCRISPVTAPGLCAGIDVGDDTVVMRNCIESIEEQVWDIVFVQ